MKTTTGLLLGDIAVTPEDQIWTVDFDCVGVLRDRAPKMKIFDLHTGKKITQLAGPDGDVRYAVSASRDGHRIVAYTGKVKGVFDWGDLDSYDKSVNHSFTVWDGRSKRSLFTSEDLTSGPGGFPNGLRGMTLRISAMGRFVLYGNTIYELPAEAHPQ